MIPYVLQGFRRVAGGKDVWCLVGCNSIGDLFVLVRASCGVDYFVDEVSISYHIALDGVAVCWFGCYRIPAEGVGDYIVFSPCP